MHEAAAALQLNSAQRVALQCSVAHVVTLIQGPSGTGKMQLAAAFIIGRALACPPGVARQLRHSVQ